MFPHFTVPPSLAYEFLGNFARFEYALKEAGFAVGSGNEVHPDWDQFASKIAEAFNQVTEHDFLAAVSYLKQFPPRKQILKNGRLSWRETKVNSGNSTEILVLVRRVRNNLFHGAKTWSPELARGRRDSRLVKESLEVIRRCVDLDDAVSTRFHL